MNRLLRRVMTTAIGALLCIGAVTIALGQSPNAGGRGELALEGTIWVAKDTHRRVSVTTEGQIEIKEGKDIYVLEHRS